MDRSTNDLGEKDRAYTTTKFRTNVKIKQVTNSFSDHFHAVLLEKNNDSLKRGKGYWILNNALLNNKDCKNAIIKLWDNWRSQKHCFHSISEWWKRGKKHVKDFTKLYTRATTQTKTNGRPVWKNTCTTRIKK